MSTPSSKPPSTPSGAASRTSSPVQAVARVVTNEQLTPEMYKMILRLPSGWGPARAGQFVQMECPPFDQPGLRRPYSVAGYRETGQGTEIDIVYGAVGTRSRGLSLTPAGESLSLIGPLGRPFLPFPGRDPVLVAGGRGIAPMLMLADEWRVESPRGIILYGVRTLAQAIPLEASAYSVHLATDDGSAGFAGSAISLLDQLTGRNELSSDRHALFACGPNAMLEALSRWAEGHGFSCQVSLETHFGCGFGICAGCAVPVKPGAGREPGAGERDPFGKYVLACREGPVMDGLSVDWENFHE